MDLNKHLRSMAQAITETLGDHSLRQTAKETGFLKRSSKLKPEAFLSLCTLLKDSVGKNTLPNLCSQKNPATNSILLSLNKLCMNVLTIKRFPF